MNKWHWAAVVVILTCLMSRPALGRNLWRVFPPPLPSSQTVFTTPGGGVAVFNQTPGFMVGPYPTRVQPLYSPYFRYGSYRAGAYGGGSYGGYGAGWMPYGGYYWRPY